MSPRRLLTIPVLFAVTGCSAPHRVDAAELPSVTPTASLELRAAVERSVPLLQATMETWIREEETCISCHHQGLGTMAVVFASERGVVIDDELHARQMARILDGTPSGVLHGNAGINATFGRSFQLLALGAAGTPRDGRTDALAHFLAGNAVRRDAESRWLSVSYRPPLEASEVTGTAVAVRALDLFRPDARATSADDTIARARRWLERLEPQDAEQRAMRLFGLAWSGASESHTRDAADAILRAQRPDGGWAQLDTLESDAYATGQALVALQQMAGIAPRTPAFERGVRFLLDRQNDDGSWLVKTRRRSPGLPYFETGFPHGMHQFISTAATAWASMALCCALDPAPSRVFHGERAERSAATALDGLQNIHLAAAFGTLEELRAALDDGADPNAMGVEGLRPLHLAVHDAERVDLLLERGASVDARTAHGVTALILAAWYDSDNDRAAELLIAHGADVNARAEADGMTPLLRAARSSKLTLVRQLLDLGADPIATDAQGMTALHWSTIGGDVPMSELLLRSGVAVDTHCDGATALHWASHDGHDGVVRLLLEHGADGNAQDADGMTPLAWAAKVDHGNVLTLDALLDAGADPALPTAVGRTPLDWATRFANRAAESRLKRSLERR